MRCNWKRKTYELTEITIYTCYDSLHSLPKDAFTPDTKQPKFDIIDNMRKVATDSSLRKRLG